MDCSELYQHLEGLLDGEAAANTALQQHLAACTHCRRLLAACRETIQVYRAQPVPPIPATLHRKLMDKVGGRAAPTHGSRPHPSS